MSHSKTSRDISARRRKKQEKGLPWAYILPAIIVIILIIGAVYVETRSGTITTTALLSGNLDFPYPCLGTEALFLHIHPYLKIIIDGKNVTIPGAIGIENPVAEGIYTWGEVYTGGSASCFEPVHTHDSSGLIHIESPDNQNYTLGDFFNIWSQTYSYALVDGMKHPIVFNSTDILGYTTNSTYSLVLLVDGKPSNAFGSLVLNTLDYCSPTITSTSSPCYPTDWSTLTNSAGQPEWNGGTGYPYGTGHTIVIEYGPSSSV
ncbi:MAG TPA: hypothetical protein VED17_09190 [Nitrososphaerales archaeon]|nr:hypothetical protein [Nitrososphaerales archaeon]